MLEKKKAVFLDRDGVLNVESEIGDRAEGKQVLKNVGKVEKFVLEQVRKIFEDECVYPSFWTILIWPSKAERNGLTWKYSADYAEHESVQWTNDR